jgi:hypothetical protein
MASKDQKVFWANFRKKYNYGKEIDAEIFDKEGWFRLPNQTKQGQDGTEHIIQKGEMKDFILKYVEEAQPYQIKKQDLKNLVVLKNEEVESEEDETVIETFDTEKKNDVEPFDKEKDGEKYEDLLFNVIENKKKIDWDTWFKIAGVLKSNGYDFEVFDKYSALNKKMYSHKYTKELWNGIKKEEMNIHTLQNIAKNINNKKYLAWLSKYNGIVNTFDDVAKEFEKDHCKIISKSIFIKQSQNENIVMNRQALKTSYEHLIYKRSDKNGDIIDSNFINDWLVNNPKQRSYENIGVYPNDNLCPKNVFNMWRKFDMELISEYTHHEEGLKFMLDHIKTLCNNDVNVSDYLIAWISQMIQYPEVKSICPTFISKEGTGKGTLIRLFEKMLGHSKVFETTNPSRDIWGDFNGRMANTFLINLNELSKKDTIECEGKIKGLITDPKLTINNKGSNQYDIESHHRFIISTNNEEPVNTSKDDRRKIIIRCSDELIGNKTYFDKMYDYLENVNIIKTCFQYFKNYKIKTGINDDGSDIMSDMSYFNKIPMPITEYQSELQSYSTSPIELWLKDWTEKYDDEQEELEWSSTSLLESFNSWKNKNNVDYSVNSLKLSVRMGRLNIKGVCKKHTKNGNVTVFNVPLMRKHFGVGCLIESS